MSLLRRALPSPPFTIAAITRGYSDGFFIPFQPEMESDESGERCRERVEGRGSLVPDCQSENF